MIGITCKSLGDYGKRFCENNFILNVILKRSTNTSKGLLYAIQTWRISTNAERNSNAATQSTSFDGLEYHHQRGITGLEYTLCEHE